MSSHVVPDTQQRERPDRDLRETLQRDDLERPRGLEEAANGWLWILLFSLVAIGIGAVFAVTQVRSRSAPGIHGAQMTHKVARGALVVSVTEQGTLESSENTEIICQVNGDWRSGGRTTVTWVVENGQTVKAGDDLVRLDTLYIEEEINERTKYAHWSRAGADSWKFQMARRKLAVPEYLEGRYVVELMEKEKELAIAESDLGTAKNLLVHAEQMAARGYVSELEVERSEFQVTQFQLDVEVKQTEIDVLKRFTKTEQLANLNGEVEVAKAQFEASDERAFADESRRDRSVETLGFCVMKAPRDGLVIYPSAAKWKNEPDITVGGSVHKEQLLLIMPDLTKMQVKIGIHESLIDRIKAGLTARVTLADRTIEAKISSVATVTQPGGWWTGNVVKYDTIIAIPPGSGLKPGMSAEVEVLIAQHPDELLIPVAAVVETEGGFFCWVQRPDGPQRQALQLGDSNDAFMIVKSGIQQGDAVLLNPVAFVEGAQGDATQTPGQAELQQGAIQTDAAPQTQGTEKPTDNAKQPATESQPAASTP